jgi:hypothetical protein
MRERTGVRGRLSYANVVASLALFIAVGGASAFAAGQLAKNSVGPKQLKKNAVTTAKIKKEAVTAAKVKKGTLTGTQINASTLGTVPNAQHATTADSLPPSEPWHQVGAPGEPAFEHSWSNQGEGQTVAFYKDQLGVVHLRGIAKGGTPTEAIFTLPPGFRPAAGPLLPFAVACLPCAPNGAGALVVGQDGPGTVEAPVAENVSLEGLPSAPNPEACGDPGSLPGAPQMKGKARNCSWPFPLQ